MGFEEVRPEKKISRFIDYTIGASDGLILSFVLVSGLTVVFTPGVVTAIASSALLLWSIAMGLARYYQTPELPEHHHEDQEEEADESWQLEAEVLHTTSVAQSSAWNIGLAYFLGGILPLLPFALVDEHPYFKTAAGTFLMIVILGWARAMMLKKPIVNTILPMLLLCAAASAGVWLTARLFV